MNVVIETKIQNSKSEIAKRFNQELFEALKPPLISLKVLRFDGCKTGDQVHLEISPLGILPELWISHITSDIESEFETTFVDKGVKIPFPLVYWEHHHKIIKLADRSSIVVDDIRYKTNFILFDYLMYPVFFCMFFMRKPVYKKYLS